MPTKDLESGGEVIGSTAFLSGVSLFCLDSGLQLSAKDSIPEPAGDAESQFVVKEVMGEVVLFQLLVPQGQVLVM